MKKKTNVKPLGLIVGLIGLFVFPIGCGNDSEDLVEQTLTVFTWHEYVSPDVIAQFTEETGIAVNVEAFGSGDEMIDRIRSEPGKFDVVIADEASVGKLLEVKLAAPLDTSLLPGIANLDPRFMRQHFDAENKYSLPYFWGSTLIAYNREKIPNPDPSWSLLSDSSLKGKVHLYSDKHDLVLPTLLAAGLTTGDESDEVLKVLRERLQHQVENVEVQFGSDADARSKMLSGEVWAALMFSGDAAMIAEENPAIDFFVPREGVPIWIDSFVIPRDTEKYELAHQFIEFILRPEVAAASSNYFWFASPNAKAQEFLDPELLGDERINLPTTARERSSLSESMSPEFERAVNEILRGLQKLNPKAGALVTDS
jgi:spermidine/putrescine transport system substrate-binding protein